MPADAWLTCDHHPSRISQRTVSEDCCLGKTGMSVTSLRFLVVTLIHQGSFSTYWPSTHNILQLPNVSSDLWLKSTCMYTSTTPRAPIHAQHWARPAHLQSPRVGATPVPWSHRHCSYWNSTVGFNSHETSCKTYRLQLNSSISLPGFIPLCAHSCLRIPGITPLSEEFRERSLGVGEWLKICILMYKDWRWNGCPVRPRWGCGRKWGEILLTSAFQVSSTTSSSERGREQWLEVKIALLPQI